MIQVEYPKFAHQIKSLDQKDCVGYIKTAAVLAAYVDQSISTNTFYNPAHFPEMQWAVGFHLRKKFVIVLEMMK